MKKSIPQIDRFFTVYFFYHQYKYRIRKNNSPVPILMYHSISNENDKRVNPYYQLNTTPKIFADHIHFLKQNNYVATDIGKALKCPQSREESQAKFVILTFDDGFEDFYHCAYPILQKYKFSATVFLATDYIGKVFKKKRCLTWNQIKELNKLGIKFGSHTVTHPQLKNLPIKQIYYELVHSKQIIENKLGTEIDSFSYPFAFPEYDAEYTQYFGQMLNKHGYKHCVTTIVGTEICNGRTFLRRLPISSADDQQFFHAKLIGAYDWLHNIQYFYKFIRNIRWITKHKSNGFYRE